jgi:bifunctional non-homologous end joining protein LigD
VDKDLIHVGRAGTGFTEKSAKELISKFAPLIRKTSPFKPAPKTRANEDITWLKPALAAEIKFAEWTEDMHLRQPSFKGLRADKNPKEIIIEIPDDENNEQMTVAQDIIKGIKISNPDKIIFTDPETTKLDVIRYYESVAEMMLPYIEERILSIVRCPKGASGACFYKKHPEPGRPGLITFEDYLYIKDISGLISEAQMGTLEFHTWGSRVKDIEKPDMIVFDLDPDEGMELKQVRQGVRDLRSILNELSLNAYLKTSGGKGYHVVVPIRKAASWEAVRDFSKSIVQVMEKKWPDRYTSNSRKLKRAGKIYVDWLRNVRGATSIAPYSLRARPGAAVSMPIAWEELNKIAPDGINIKAALRRLKKNDPWEGFFAENQTVSF